MSIKVYTIGSELKSAKTLGFDTYTEMDSDYTETYDKDVIVRLGNSNLLYGPDFRSKEFKNSINTSKAIALNCNKKFALENLSEVVNTPKIFYGEIPKDQLVVYRPVQHAGGVGFSVKKGPFEVDWGMYATEWIETDTEYRAWFINGKVMLAQRVTQRKDRLNQKFKCRSLWPYKYIDYVPPALKKQVLAAANKIGLELGAADILYKNGEYKFLELNSAPTLDLPWITEFYKENIIALAKKKFPKIKI